MLLVVFVKCHLLILVGRKPSGTKPVSEHIHDLSHMFVIRRNYISVLYCIISSLIDYFTVGFCLNILGSNLSHVTCSKLEYYFYCRGALHTVTEPVASTEYSA